MVKYAVYARVSTEKEEQVTSLENQIDIARNWLERNGYNWNERNVYKDEGISGTLLLERPAMQLILQKAKKKEIEMVIFKSISRLARDLSDALQVREVLSAYGVRIISIEEAYDSFKAGKNDMVFEMASMFAAHYSKMLSSSISAALAAKVRRGETAWRAPYGYRKEDDRLIPDEIEAPIVRMMYEWYLQGFGYIAIASKLNEKDIKPKKAQQWKYSTVERILRNEMYTGDFVLNKYNKVKLEGRKKQIRNPREKWIIFPDHHPAIIDRDTFQAAQNKRSPQKKRASTWNEFRDILKCAHCGGAISVWGSSRKKADGTRTRWNYLKCLAYKNSGGHDCVKHEPIQYEEFRVFIISVLKQKSQDFSINIEDNLQKRNDDKVKEMEASVVRLQTQRKRLLDLYLKELLDSDEFESKRIEIDREVEDLQQNISVLQQIQYTDTSAKEIRRAFDTLEDIAEDLYESFNILIDQIRLYQDGKIDIDYNFESVR